MSLDLDEQNEIGSGEPSSTNSRSSRAILSRRSRPTWTRGSRGDSAWTPSDLRPWHYDDLFFQEAPRVYDVDLDGFFRPLDVVEVVRNYFGGLGLEVERHLSRGAISTKDRARTSTRSARTSTARETSAVLANVKNDEMWAGTMLHELGHAVYDQHIDPDLPFLLRHHAHTLVTEAVAMMFGRLSKDPHWIASVGGSSGGAADEISRYLTVAELVFARWAQVMIHFERALYRDPEQDLTSRWWELVERFQMVRRPEDRRLARLGGQDPRGVRPGLLPQLSSGRGSRVAAFAARANPCGAGLRALAERVRRPRRRPVHEGSGLPPRRALPMGQAHRTGDGRASHTAVFRGRVRRWQTTVIP